jgi:hypothetical protein
MPRRRRALQPLLSAVVLLATAIASAQPPQSETEFEITPFAGYRFGGAFRLANTGQHVSLENHDSFALALDVWAEEGEQYEVFYSREATALRADGFAPVRTVVEYLHLGGTVTIDNTSPVRPYYAGGIGVTRLSPDAAFGREDTRFSLSLALGLRAPISRNLLVRLEARGILTPVGANTALFCRSAEDALCQVRVRGSSVFQGDVLAGLAFAF